MLDQEISANTLKNKKKKEKKKANKEKKNLLESKMQNFFNRNVSEIKTPKDME